MLMFRCDLRARLPRRRLALSLLSSVMIASLVLPAGVLAAGSSGDDGPNNQLQKIQHIVVIYEENHSFDNLFSGWEHVNGLARADDAHTQQVNQAGLTYSCLEQDDVNLATPPLAGTCTDSTTGTPFSSAFTNQPFNIDTYIPSTAVTCPAPTVFGPANGYLNGDPNALPGGCTRDLVHRYYQEQYQIDKGKQDRYMTGSDALGLVMGYYDTRSLPIYEYLHSPGHPQYAIADHFFQAAFGGSFLNHQWLIAAATPLWVNAVNDGSSNDLHSVLDASGVPNNYGLYASPLTTTVGDRQLTQSCNPAPNRGALQSAFTCGDYAVNTTQPFYQPYSPGTAVNRRLPPLTTPNIGDKLTAAGVDWAWYSGGWSNANGDIDGPGWTNGHGPTCSDPNHNTSASVVFPNCLGPNG
jgi:acid phosphatase